MVFHQDLGSGKKRKLDDSSNLVEKSYRCQEYTSCKGRIYVKGDICTKMIKPHTCGRDRPDRLKILNVS